MKKPKTSNKKPGNDRKKYTELFMSLFCWFYYTYQTQKNINLCLFIKYHEQKQQKPLVALFF